MTTITHHVNTDNTVAVSNETYWMPIDEDTPRGVKLQLLGSGGVAVYGMLTRLNTFFTHWCPLPKKLSH